MRALATYLVIALAACNGIDTTRPLPLAPPSAAKVVGDGPAAFTITCTYYNYCTFTGTQSGTWQFSDWAAWGAAAIVTAVSYERPMSTHNPVTFATPYTTTITHTVGTDVDVGYVRCGGDWTWRSMCREVPRP
jgi:hypothetical protein